jgi:KDO2-lipid IV(A) lauroyltransferase
MLAFYLAYPFLFLVTRLSFSALYRLSDFLYVVIYKGLKYRKKVVFENLKNAFPQKSESEIALLAAEYYSFLCDLFLEAIKKRNMTVEEARQRYVYRIPPDVAQLRDEKRSLILLMGHYGNWECGDSTFEQAMQMPLYVVYKTLSNPYFEKWMSKTRSQFGAKLIKMENTLRDMLSVRQTQGAFAFIADQTPVPPAPLWLNFLHQDTPVFTGAEKLARKLDYPVLFFYVKRIKRGYYEVVTEVLCAHPKATAEHEITHAYFARLEKEIEMMPETWLWSHRRWKHKRGV